MARGGKYGKEAQIPSQIADLQNRSGGSSAPNVKYLDNYSSSSGNGTDWAPAFTQAFADLGTAGGQVQLGAKTYMIKSTVTIPTNVQIVGLGQGISIIQLAQSINTDMITLDTHQNCGISNLTIKGNAWSGGTPSSGKDGLVIGRAGVPNDGTGTMPNLNIHDIEIRDIGGNGFHCYLNTWVYYLARVSIKYCTGYGAYIQSTDNLYESFDITANGNYGLYITGSNNRFSNMKIIFNGRGQKQADNTFIGNGTDINSAGVYSGNGVRNTFVNIESQENYGHGFVFDGAADADLLGLVADKNGYSIVQDNGAGQGQTIKAGFSKSAVGFYFMNSCARLTGIIKGTNFNTGLVTQICTYYVDSTCSNISLDVESDATQGLSSNLSYTSYITTSDTRVNALVNSQYNDLLTSGMTLTNQITAYDSTSFSLGTNFIKTGYTITGNDIYGSTEWANSPRIGTLGNKPVVAGNLYLARVKVKPDTNNYYLRLKTMYNDGAFETITTLGGNYSNAAYTDISFVFKAPRAGNLLAFVEDKVGANNATQGAFHISEMSIVDITSVISAKYHPKTADQLVKKNYFLGSRAFV